MRTPRLSPAHPPLSAASAKIAIGFIVFSAAWVVLSDVVLHYALNEPPVLWKFESVKGFVFLIATGVMLYLVYRADKLERQAVKVGEPTLRRLSAAARIAIGYIVFSSVWVVLSDAVLHYMMGQPSVLWKFESAKGLVFVVATGIMLYLVYRVEDAAQRHALNISQSSLQRLVESGMVGVCFWNEDWELVNANDTLLGMLGYTRAALSAGIPKWRELTPPEYAALDAEAMRQLETKGVCATYEKELLRKDGSRIAVMTGAAFLNESTRRAVGYALDITELKRTKRELEGLEEQLRQSEKLSAIGLLAGGVAHDFNNLLQVIIGYTTLVQLELSDGHLVGYTQQVLKAGDKASMLIKKLLAFSRKQELKPDVIDLNAALADMMSLLRRVVGEQITVFVQQEPTLGRVRVDLSQIEQVLMNLVVNARDAMPKGGELTIETKNFELSKDDAKRVGVDPGPYVVLSVRDTGTGMTPEVKSHIFEPFFTTKQVGTGTGLGLATVHGTVNQSGGSITVDSELGTGSTFTVYLPCVQKAPEAAGKVPAPTEIAPPGSGTILVVEDEEEPRVLMKQVLESAGYNVLAAHNGEDAISIAGTHLGPIDLLLSDLVMPQIDGREAARRIRQIKPGIKVIFLSGYLDKTQPGPRALEESVLEKPISPRALTLAIKEVLAGKQFKRSTDSAA